MMLMEILTRVMGRKLCYFLMDCNTVVVLLQNNRLPSLYDNINLFVYLLKLFDLCWQNIHIMGLFIS